MKKIPKELIKELVKCEEFKTTGEIMERISCHDNLSGFSNALEIHGLL